MISLTTKKRARLLPFLFGFLPAVFCSDITHAQSAEVPVTGFNADFVADGTDSLASVSTTATFGNYVVVSSTFGTGATACGTAANTLPANNQVTSTNTTNNTGITYTLQPYGNGAATHNNTLNVIAGSSGTFTLVTPVSAGVLYLVGMGNGSFTATINYTDSTTETVAGLSMPDWCSGAATYRLTGAVLNRIRVDQTNCGTCPYLFEVPVAISPANFSKTIASITINNTGANPIFIFAVGKKDPCTTPAAPTALSFGTPTYTSISGSFTASGATNYLVVRYPSGSMPTAPVDFTTYSAGMSLGTGTVVSAGNTTGFTATGLSTQTTYDFYVYGYNGGACAGPVYSTMTLMGSQATAFCAAITSTTPDTICAGMQAGLQATPDAGSTIKWYSNATGGTALATANSFTTPALNATTNYYAEASKIVPEGFAGKTQGGGTSNSAQFGLQFNALTNIKIDSVAVWVGGNGQIAIEVRNGTNTTLMQKTVQITNSGGTPGTPVKIYVPLNFNVQAGTNYRLVTGTSNGVAMLRESTGVTGFPYTIPDVISLTASISSNGTSILSNRYYYFYEVHVSTACTNPTRQAVTATVTEATVDVTAATPNMNCGATAVSITSNSAVTWTMEGGNLYTDSAATMPYTTGTATTDVFGKAVNNRYVKGTYILDGCSFADSVLVTVSNPAVAPMLANNTGAINTDSSIVSNTAADLHNADCELIARLTPAGSSPVAGWLTGKAIMDGSVQNTATGPYVTRHFELTPKANAAGSSAMVTLYFTQAEFDAYNTYVTTNGMNAVHPLLPASPAESGNTANIWIDKFNAASGSPGPANNNSVIVIAPTSVTWETANNWWAVTFLSTGFSGFFLHTNVTQTPLPVNWIATSATLNRQKQAVINWSVAEKEATGYRIQKSVDGNKFENLATVNSKGNGNHTYSYMEESILNGKAWYRIVQTGKDGREDYSRIMELQNSSIYGRISIYPNPAKHVLTVETETVAVYGIYDLQGKAVMKGNLQSGKNTLNVSGLAKGFYTIKIGDYNQKIVLQ
ncbi:T9SS type A sorting domain-containing protein [Taibaiella lutea]|uniref:T9SS type A sorting domain-containing protein n=1 Tax=Taibaiella lutea TaxID=2608001 RepID=A0A5M6CHK0_9BACT|nr:T9SS type A sorting domain-containing protein [Taibaiella lutea]KAA5534671.1 T9SS type A sorting domain-containing protein [Taibaiella lutea]